MATVYPVPDPQFNPRPYDFDNEQEILRLLSRGGGVQPAPQQAPAAGSQAAVQRALPRTVESLSGLGNDLHSRGMALAFQEPNTSALQEYARQRGEQGNAAMLNALAAQFAGESFAPMQAHFLKKAAAAQDPMKLSGGILTAEGKFLKDPFAEQDKKANMLLQLARHYEQMATTAETAQQRADALRERQAIQDQFRMLTLQIQQDRAAQGQVGAFHPTGFTPAGESVVTNTKNGLNYLIKVDQNGVPTYTPYQGPAIPKASQEKMIVDASNLGGRAFNADMLIKKVESNPDAFGLRGATVGAVPGAFQGYVSKAVGLTPEQMKVRSDVLRQAAMEINELYGAALSLGEQARADSFIPNAKDPPETVINKLKAARDWAQSKLGTMPQGVQSAVSGRSGSQTNSDDPLGLRK